ncbi:MAG: hypothetical protein Q9193_005614, partial [Seirophora villosa]
MIQNFNFASDAADVAGGSYCSICHDTLLREAAAAESPKLAMSILACGHTFHEYCLMLWLSPIQFVDYPPPSTNTEQQPREAIEEERPQSASPSSTGDHHGGGEASEEAGSPWQDVQRRARRLEQLLDRVGLLQDPPPTSVLAQRILGFIGENRDLIGRLHRDGDGSISEGYIGMWRELLEGMEMMLGVDDAELVAQGRGEEGTLPRHYGYETTDEPEEDEILEMESLAPNRNRNSPYNSDHPSPWGLLSALAALDPRTREEAETGDDGLEEGESRETESPNSDDPAESASREEVEALGSRLLQRVSEAFYATSEETESDPNAEDTSLRSEESLEDGETREADEVQPVDPHVSDSQYLPPVDMWDGSIMDPNHGPTAPDTSEEPTTQSSHCPLCRETAFNTAFPCCTDTLRLLRARLRLTNLAYGIFSFERSEAETSERNAITTFLRRRHSDSVVLEEEPSLPSAPDCRRIFTTARRQLRDDA